MATRNSSINILTNLATSPTGESIYDAILAVSLHLDAINAVAAGDLAALTAAWQDAKNFTGISVVSGDTAGWDAVNRILTVPTVKGDKGPQGDIGLTGVGVKGPKGDTGSPGPAGQNITVTDVTYQGSGVFVWTFSDNSTFTTPDLRGAKGDQGIAGVSVHHTRATSTTELHGNFGIMGEIDTYTLYGDNDETINLGSFVVGNGLNPYESNPYSFMSRSTYDVDNDGIVDDSTRLGGKTLDTIEAERTAEIRAAELGLGTNYYANDLPARNALTGLTVGDKVYVSDDGDGKWAQYYTIAVVDGNGSTSTFEKVMDQDALLNSLTTGGVKAAYESNPDTNAYTDEDLARVAKLGSSTTALNTIATEGFAAINELVAADTTIRNELTTADAAIRNEVAVADEAVRSELIAADTAIRNELAAADTAIRNEVAAADDVVRSEFVAADAALRSEFVAADTTIRNELAAADDVVRSEFVTADAAVRSELIAADTAVRDELTAADAAVRNEFAAADNVVRNDFVAADNIVRDELTAADAAIRNELTTTDTTIRNDFVAADNVVRNDFVAADDIVRSELIAADTAIRNEFAAADTTIRSEFAAADTTIRSEFAVADDIVRSEFVAADDIIRNDFVVADDIVRSELITADTAIRNEFAAADSAVRGEFAAADDIVRNEFAAADSAVRGEFAAADDIVRNEFVAADNVIRNEFVAADNVIRNEFVAADNVIRNEFVAADDIVRNEFAAADTAIRSEFATADDIVRGEVAAADTAIRSEFATADTAIRNELIAADTAVRNELIAADDVVRNELIAADTTIRSEVAAADAALRSEFVAADTTIRNEVAATQSGAGLAADGSYTANGAANYTSGATSLSDADNALDAAIKTNADAITALDSAALKTSADVLTKLLAVDGAGTGLDADLLDGMNTGQTGGSYIPYTNANGNLLIGTTTDNGIDKLQVNGTIGGTAVTQSSTDTTVGRLLKVGDYGISEPYENFSYGSVVARVKRPGVGSMRYKIRLPWNVTDVKMLKITVEVYSNYVYQKYDISGYLYSTINNWYAPRCVYTSSSSIAPSIVVGRDTDGRAYVSVNTSSYTGIVVRDLLIGHDAADTEYKDRNWTITEDATTPNPASMTIDTIYHSGNDGVGSGLDADLLDGMNTGQTGGSYIPYTNANGNLLIGTTTDNGIDKLQVNGSIKTNVSNGLISSNATANQDYVFYTQSTTASKLTLVISNIESRYFGMIADIKYFNLFWDSNQTAARSYILTVPSYYATTGVYGTALTSYLTEVGTGAGSRLTLSSSTKGPRGGNSTYTVQLSFPPGGFPEIYFSLKGHRRESTPVVTATWS